jgi:serine/threonine-protein kinase
VYSLGVVAYELLAGARPYKLKRGSAAELEEAIAAVDAPLASAVATDAAARKELKGDLEAILNKALKKNPDERYATVDAFAQDIERYLGGQRVVARPDSLAYRLTRFARRYRTPLAAAAITVAAFGLAIGVGATALVILALLLGLGAALWQARKARQQAEIAHTEARISAAVQDFLESIFTASSGDQAEPARARQRTAVELLDEGAARVDQALDKAPQARIRVLKTLAAVYEDMMLHDRAADLRGRAARVAGAVHGIGSSEHIGLLAAQAQALNAGGHNEQARTVLADADRLLAAQREPDTDSRMAVDIAMADLYNYQEDERGLPFAERAMQMLRREAPSPAWVDALTVLGGLRRTVGDFEAARRALAEAVDVAATMPGNVASKLPTVYDLWGFTELESGQSDRGIELLRKVVAMDEAAGGPDSPNVFIGKGRLASALLEEGFVTEALDIARAMRERLAGLPALEVFSFSTQMKEAEALLTIGRCGEALQRLRQLPDVDGQAARFPMHAFTTWLLTARALSERGDYDEAALALDRAQRVVSERDLGSSVATLRLSEARAQLWLDRGRAEEARGEAQPMLAAEGSHRLQPARRRIIDARIALGESEPGAAEATARAAIAEIAAGGPAARGRRLHEPILKGLLGRALLLQERAREAVPVLRDALREIESVRDPSTSLDVAALHAHLGLALLSAGEKAAALFELEAANAIRARNDHVGPQHVRAIDRLAERLRRSGDA